MTGEQIGELFKQYELYLLRFILSRLYEGCPPDYAYDCLDEVFAIALEKKEDANFNYNPPGWLKTTTIHVIENYNRKQTNRLRFHHSNYDFDLDSIPTSDHWFEDMAYRLAVENDVWTKIMDELKPDDRVLLIMRYYQNMELDDIAFELGISKNTLKARIHRMKSQVKKLIQKYVGA